MLVLTRKVNESIQIGPDIWVTLCRIEGDQVRLGIEAPKQINIVRTELLGHDPAKPRKRTKF